MPARPRPGNTMTLLLDQPPSPTAPTASPPGPTPTAGRRAQSPPRSTEIKVRCAPCSERTYCHDDGCGQRPPRAEPGNRWVAVDAHGERRVTPRVVLAGGLPGWL